MKKYEAIYILETRKVSDEGKGFNEDFKKTVEALGGNVEQSIYMGKKQFAREIRSRKAGLYMNYVFNLEPDAIEKLEDKFRMDERLLRKMILIYDRPESIAAVADEEA